MTGRTVAAEQDVITLQLIRHELEALMDEMEATVRRTARSSMAKAGDFSIGLTDAQGANVGVGRQTVVTPIFQRLAKAILAGAEPVEDGDVFLVNDPYSGGSHLPDIFVLKPIFHAGRRVAIAACYSHHSDVGGRFPGSQTGRAETIFEEGLRIPLVKLEAAGVRNHALLEAAAANVRPSEEFIGDIEAKLAGIRRAEANILKIADRYGPDLLEDCFVSLNTRSAVAFAAVLAELPHGTYHAEASLRDDGRGPVDQPITIRLALSIDATGVVADFAGSAPQVAGAINMPFANTVGTAMNALRELLVPDLPLNGGLMGMMDVRAEAGSVVNASFPAAVAGRAPVFLIVEELVHQALAEAMPGKVPALREAWDVLHFSKRTNEGSQLSLMDIFCGGWGGRPDADGIDGIAPTGTTTMSAELIEREYPLLIEGFGLVPDTGGPGERRGSLAVYRSYLFREAASIMIRTTKPRPTNGIDGGLPGAPACGRAIHAGEARIMAGRTYDHLAVVAGDRYCHRTSGAGGYGDPFRRDAEAVLRDVIEERLSTEAAERDYGVAITGSPPRIDEARTSKLRERASAPPREAQHD